MITVLFVCLGNICRSPMAEAVFLNMVEKEGLADKVRVDSAGTSSYEKGNPVHRGTKERLLREGIGIEGRVSRPLEDEDLEADYIIGMDDSNIEDIQTFIKSRPSGKVYKILEFANRSDNIADPYYTGDFDATYSDVVAGCKGLLDHIKETYF